MWAMSGVTVEYSELRYRMTIKVTFFRFQNHCQFNDTWPLYLMKAPYLSLAVYDDDLSSVQLGAVRRYTGCFEIRANVFLRERNTKMTLDTFATYAQFSRKNAIVRNTYSVTSDWALWALSVVLH